MAASSIGSPRPVEVREAAGPSEASCELTVAANAARNSPSGARR